MHTPLQDSAVHSTGCTEGTWLQGMAGLTVPLPTLSSQDDPMALKMHLMSEFLWVTTGDNQEFLKLVEHQQHQWLKSNWNLLVAGKEKVDKHIWNFRLQLISQISQLVLLPKLWVFSLASYVHSPVLPATHDAPQLPAFQDDENSGSYPSSIINIGDGSATCSHPPGPRPPSVSALQSLPP